MYINTLSPVLDEMLVQDNTNDIVHLEFSDAAMLKEFFAEKVIQGLLQKQKMLLIAPDRMDSSIPSKILTKYNLAHYSVLYSSLPNPRPRVADRMSMLTKLKDIPLLRQEFQHSVLKYKEINNKIHDTLLSITKKNIKNPSFREMLLSIKPRPKTAILESVIEAISEISINPEIIQGIRQLQNIFQKRFVYMDECRPITASCLEDDETLNYAKEETSVLQSKIEKTTIEIERELYLMKRVISYEVEEELNQWAKLKEELQNVFLESELDSFPSSFEATGIPIINQFAGCKYLKLSLNIKPEIGWGQVPQILNIVTSIMEGAGRSIDIYFEDYVRKLSPFNTNNHILDTYIEEGINALKAINSSKYIHHSCTSKFLQVDVLLGELKDARLKIGLCQNTLNDNEYLNFLKARKNLNISEPVMQALYYLDNENWGDIIEFYGHRSHLTLNYNSNMNRLEDWYKDLENAHQIVKHTSTKEVHNRWCHLRNQALVSVRNNNWDFYKEVFESGTANYSIRQIVEKMGSQFQNFFPVMVVKESELKYILSEPDLQFDTTFFLDPKEISITDVSMLVDKNMNLTIASTHSLDLQDVIDNYNVISNYCSDARISQTMILNELEKTERYRYALSLSANLTGIIRQANIYRIGDTVIISTVDPLLDKRLNTSLNISSNNVLFNATKEMSHFVETFLHYDKIVLIVENNLLNDHNGISTLWQKSVLQQIESAGISVRNINTHELYQNLSKTIEEVTNEFKNPVVELNQEEVTLAVV